MTRSLTGDWTRDLPLVWLVVQAIPTFIEVPSDLSRGQTQSSVISAFLFSPSPSVGLLSSSGYTITSLRRKNTENRIQVEKRYPSQVTIQNTIMIQRFNKMYRNNL